MKVKVGDQEVTLESKHLEVAEHNLNDFLINFASIYNYYNMAWAKAQYILHLMEDRHEVSYSERFQFYKENEGGSDKLVDAKVKMHEQVVSAKKAGRDAKYAERLLYTYLRALDKANENALNLGYNIRKEMDKIYPQVVKGTELQGDVDAQVAKLLSEGETAKDA